MRSSHNFSAALFIRTTAAVASTALLSCTSEAPRLSFLAGAASATALNQEVSLSATSPLGGAAPYLYQWHRDTTAGFVPSVGNALPERTLVTMDRGLTNGRTYFYRLTATDQDARSVTYAEVSATPVGAPFQVGSATATASDGIVSLSATPATGGIEPYTYQWHRSTASGFMTGVSNMLSGKTTLSETDSGLSNGTTYYYKLVVSDNSGATRTYATVSATPRGALIVGTSSATAGNGQVTLAATAPSGGLPPYSYQWHRSLAGAFAPTADNRIPKTALNDTDAGLGNDTTYYYRLVASDAAGTSVIYGEISATPTRSLTAGIASASPGNGEVLLTATSAAGGAPPYSYQWHRGTAAGFVVDGSTALAGKTDLNATDVGLTNGTTYYYKLVATDSAAASVTYAEVSATPSAAFTAGVATAAPGDALIALTATAPTGGVSPYAFQWHRSTTEGFVPAAATVLVGKTALSAADVGLTNGTRYFYRLMATDNTGATVTYDEVSAVPAAATEPLPGTSDVVVYDDNFSGFATLSERHARYLELSGGTAPFHFFTIAPGGEARESIIAGGFDGSPYAYRIMVPATTSQLTSNGSVRHGNLADPNNPYAPLRANLIVDIWVRFNVPAIGWFKGIELFHPSGQDRTQVGPFPSSHSAAPWNVHPQSNNKPIWAHIENGAPDAPTSYLRWEDITTGQWQKWTFEYRASTQTGSATDGVARFWINGVKLIDASLSGLNSGWMLNRPLTGEPPFQGNVGWKRSGLTGIEALRSLADDPVRTIIFPGVILPNNVAGTIDVGRVRVWYRP